VASVGEDVNAGVGSLRGSPAPAEIDDALVGDVARGSADAFAVLVDRHSPALFRVAWRMLGSSADAEDAVQETFTKLWSQAAGWKPGGLGAGPWLHRVCVNHCLDRLRRRKHVADCEPPERADPATGAEYGLVAEQTRVLARQAIMRLPERQRAAIILTYYEELPNAAVAEILGLNVKALESLLVRARQALRAMLADADVDIGALEGSA
jgi:RNA polymerase sigma-70 factor (ECF subfamily)